MNHGFLARALGAYRDWPLPASAFYQQCRDCDEALFADTPCYCDPDADCEGDPLAYVDRTVWLCVPCAEARGYTRQATR